MNSVRIRIFRMMGYTGLLKSGIVYLKRDFETKGSFTLKGLKHNSPG